MITQEELEAIKARAEKSHKVISDLCNGRTHWTMSIPARPDEDSDLVLASSLRDIDTLIKALEQVVPA